MEPAASTTSLYSFWPWCGSAVEQSASFTADRLTEPNEAEIIDAWFDCMRDVRDRLAPGLDPKVIHWSHAEETWLERAWYAAVKRHPEKDWPHPNWFDFLRTLSGRSRSWCGEPMASA